MNIFLVDGLSANRQVLQLMNKNVNYQVSYIK